MLSHHCQDLIDLFNATFEQTEQTILVSGGTEPLYLPSDKDCAMHRIIFTQDYYASALHEIAHWCIAGKQRRLLVDYGYWYNPDGRNEQQQALFQQVEVKPQALEWIFSLAAGTTFQISQDNLTGDCTEYAVFTQCVSQQVHDYLTHRLPERAEKFRQVLLDFYRQSTKVPL